MDNPILNKYSVKKTMTTDGFHIIVSGGDLIEDYDFFNNKDSRVDITDYFVCTFVEETEGSLKGKFRRWDDVNGIGSDWVFDELPSGIEIGKDYMNLQVVDIETKQTIGGTYIELKNV